MVPTRMGRGAMDPGMKQARRLQHKKVCLAVASEVGCKRYTALEREVNFVRQ